MRLRLAPLVLVTSLACASAGVDSVQKFGADTTLPRPPILLVYDFAVSPTDALVDAYGSQFAPATTSQEETRARKLAATLSRQIVDRLKKRGINARQANDTESPPRDAIVLRGQFVSIEEGSRVKRMVIGFGAGATKMQVNLQAYQVDDWGLRRLVQAEGSARGDRMPGMATGIGVGAAAGSLVMSAAISAGGSVVQEVTSGLESDAGRLAKKIAERTESFYRRQGWL
jgi:hypothetical protein